MSHKPKQPMGPSRRKVLRQLAGAAAAATASFLPGGFARAQDRPGVAGFGHGAEWSQGFDSASRTITMPSPRYATLTATTVQSLDRAIQQYKAIVQGGGWRTVQAGERLRVGVRHSNVVTLRLRLIASGDLAKSAGVTDIFDSYVEASVKRFQARNGISADGVLRESTIAAMNVPADLRLKQLETNVVRVRSMSGFLGDRYAVVNIPAAHLEAVENGTAVLRHTTIVGKPDRPSPVLQAKIVEVNFNPFWTVPVSIIQKDLIPKMQTEPEYLAKNKIRIYDQRGREITANLVNWQSDEAVNYMFRQDPGELNSMGTIRVNMPNPHAVYMHDTPSKNLFGEDFRFHSSGCVRIQNVREFVVWLLKDTANWPRTHIDGVTKSGERVDAKLAKPVPVYWVYITAWANPDGVVQFRDDVYDNDGLGIAPVATTRG
ncbi:MAG: L,D-transpeptidase family protein [Xanthobacteraceae bacterium]|nr:L,D-transpeptidase family protein [Xanthobacteraceae bacterium]